MDVNLMLGGLVFHFVSDKSLEINSELTNFIVENKREDIRVLISDEWIDIDMFQLCYLGQDVINNYYKDNKRYYCFSRGGPKGFLSCTVYDEKMNDFYFYLNEKPFLYPIKKIGSLIRMLPLCAIFQHYHVLFFHASQIAYKGKGILFTGPSGIGKTTQARLWIQYKNANLICNDRTLVKKENSQWFTHGFPIDGSTPIRSKEICQLGAIIILEQGQKNEIVELKVSKAVSMLLSQLVIDSWNPLAISKAMEQLLTFIPEIRVYYYRCTKEKNAVDFLEKRLIKDGVLING